MRHPLNICEVQSNVQSALAYLQSDYIAIQLRVRGKHLPQKKTLKWQINVCENIIFGFEQCCIRLSGLNSNIQLHLVDKVSFFVFFHE